MSSYMMHLCVSNNVKKKLNLTDDFLYGSLLPDILKEEGQDRNINHYIKKVLVNGEIKKLPDVSKAIMDINKFKNKQIGLGYIAHLIEDYIWFSIYIPSYAEEKEGRYIYIKDNSIHSLEEFNKDIYSDYINSNEYILSFMKENIKDLKTRLIKIADTPKRKANIEKWLNIPHANGINNNIFMTKESINSYIETATREVEKVILKLYINR